MMLPVEQPSGIVTFLFTDIEGSTRLLTEFGPDGYREELASHRQALRGAFERNHGYEVDCEGDSFFVAFADVGAAVRAAKDAQSALASGPIRVRMGLHTGRPLLDPPRYVGLDVHLAARVMSVGHGGQVVLTRATADLIDEPMRDLGEHRLKDIGAPVSLFQLGEQSFPPLKTISNTNLPRPASRFVGREREVAELVSLLQEGTRLATLTGPGGSGKTRLAIESAARLVEEFKDGVFWVGLATLRDSSLVIETIAQTIGAKGELAAQIGERQMLLLLDNFEQVIAAAPDIAALVERCPNLVLLVTSRELLRVRGEDEYPVPSLAESDALELFMTRSHLPPSPILLELCRRLDAMPLALELAAATTKVLTPKQILERIAQRLDLLTGGRDADPRQQTLRATIQWSYELLSTDEQRLFAQLAVFAGGCTLEAAEEVAGAQLDTIRSLVEKSLLRKTADRFWMLETIRDYAFEHLGSDELLRLEERLVVWVRSLAEAAEPELRGAGQSGWYERFEAEQPNLRAALASSLEQNGQAAAVIAVSVWRFWYHRGHAREGRSWLEAALQADGLESALRGRLFNALGVLALEEGDLVLAQRSQESSLRMFESGGDHTGAIHALGDLALVRVVAGDREGGLELLVEVTARARMLGDNWSLANGLQNIATLRLYQGKLAEAEDAFREACAAAAKTEDAALCAFALSGSGYVALAREDASAARARFREAAEAASEVGAQVALADALEGLAAVSAEAAPETCGRLLGCAQALREATGVEPSPEEWALVEPHLLSARGLLSFERGLRDGRLTAPEKLLAISGR